MLKLLFSDPRSFAAMALIVIFSICIHEFLHAWAALKMGDPTAAERGHLTLNPFRQMGVISLLMLLFIGIAWGQVPVNPDNLPSRKSRIIVAVAGVAGNLILSLIFTFLTYLVIIGAPQEEFAAGMLLYGGAINLILFIFNLMPVPGLDGFQVAKEFIRINSQAAAEKANIFFFFLMMLLFFSFDRISEFASSVILTILKLLLSLRGGA